MRHTSAWIGLAGALFVQVVGSSAHADKIDDYFKAEMSKQHIPGISVAVVRDGKLETARGYGLANVELESAVTGNTVFEIGSMTKQFTATLVMMLVEEGKIGLDDKISKYLEGTPETWKEVTVRHLLTHTSGVHGYTEVGDFMALARNPHTQAEIVKMVSGLPLDFKPGEKWQYSNTGYYLLGMIVEKAGGKPYDSFLKERILTPLAMNETRNGDPATLIPRRANGYLWSGKYENAPPLQPSSAFAAGELVSTVGDLAKWDAALAAGSLLKKSSFQEIWTPVKLNDGKTFDYGFGWAVGNREGHRFQSHGGGTAGFSTVITRYPDDKLTVILLTNRAGSNATALAQAVAGFYIPALAAKEVKPIEDRSPKITERLKAITLSLASGNPSPDEFTPEAKKILFPDKILEGKAVLTQMGPLKSFALIAEKEFEKTHRYQYRAVFGETALNITFVLTAEGKIAGVGMQPE